MIQKTSTRSQKLKRLLAIFLALFAIYVCFGIWGVPAIIKSQVQKRGSEALGRDLVLENVTFNPFTFETRLYGIDVGPAEGASQDLLQVSNVSVNPQIVSIFGTITLKSVTVESSDLWVSKNESGGFSFDDILESLASAAPESEPDPDAELVQAIIRQILLSDISIHFTDMSIASEYQETITLARFEGEDIGTVSKEELMLDENGAARYHWKFDGEVLTGSGSKTLLSGGATSVSPWEFHLSTDLSGFPIGSVQPYVDEFVVLNLSGKVFAQSNVEVLLAEGIPELSVNAGVEIRDFSASDEMLNYLSFESFRIENLEANPNTYEATIGSVALVKPKIAALLREDGAIQVPEMRSQSASVSSESSPEGDSGLPSFSAKLGEFRIEDGQVALEDKSIAEPFNTEINGLNLVLGDLEAGTVDNALAARARGTLSLNILGGTVSVDGGLESLDGVANASVTVQELQLNQLASYFSEYSNVKLNKGTLSVNLDVASETFEDPRVSGSISMNDLEVHENQEDHEVLTLNAMRIEGVEATTQKVDVALIQLDSPLLTVWQRPDGINLTRLAKASEEEVSEAAEEAEPTAEEATPLPIEVNLARFELLSGGVNFVDTDLLSTHRSRISEFDIKVDGIATNPEKIADFEFGGTVDGSARLAGKGKVSAVDPEHYLDLDVTFSGYDLKSTSPYWETYLGRSLGKGRFEIHSNYEIRDSQLSGSNDFRIDQLALGEKVESERAINLPIGFAIKLMQDPSGLIAYEGLPVEGDLSSPQVKPWGLVGRAIRNLILNAVSAPFKFLSSMVGGREDLDTIAFSVGELELDEVDQEKVADLQKILEMRPGITLEVAYVTDPEESEYLQKRYRRHLIANPDFEPISGVDLLYPIDEEALRANVEREYEAIKEREATALEAVESNNASESGESPEVVESETSSPRKKRSLFGKFLGVFGIGKNKNDKSESDTATESEESLSETDDESMVEEEVVEIPFEEKLALVLSENNDIETSAYWAEDLANERIQIFKDALFASDDVSDSRVFVVEPSKLGGGNLSVGALHLKLSFQ